MKQKPIVKCKAFKEYPIDVGYSTYILPFDHPDMFLVSNKKIVRTSKVIAINEDGFETENSIYKITDEHHPNEPEMKG